ncbi:OmpA family protein [Pseudozobellia thermophila]|uniref:WD40-like Beta Propeller Repeat n=1 Tax=Pseudozobellia thermophila TaxID=192903 RepID=A0A1M6K215_9FLAO|nr:OmpA family protein [Pseudozobellia thermophila]SHJ52974.1 WD40-like Beta Propeller Repeat [Pseudozobellia thermophila]
MMKKIHILLALLILTNLGGYAQEKPDRLVTKANEKYEEYSFKPAIDIFKKVLDKGYSSADLLKKLGNSYYYNADYEDAANTYKRLVDEYPDDVTPEYYFRYAQSLKTIEEYEASNEVMAKFTESTSDDLRASTYKEERDYLAEIKKNSGRYNVAPFQYNSPYSDFAPTFYKEGLLFSSDRDTGNFARYRHTWNSKDFLDLYKVNADSASNNLVVKLGDHVNTRLHESTTATNEEGTVLYFTRNNFKEGKYIKDEKGIIRLKIFRASLNDEGVWGDIEELPFNSDDYSVAHPALSPDGKTLYFASDMPGTLGESDIFRVAIKEDGSFGKPENLGNAINTEARETFPYVTKENILYFSSDGHPGLGGLDIFATKIEDDQVQGKVLNVGEPVNGRYDDFTFIFDEATKKGYFASNRSEGQGADDIYSFIETKPLVLDCQQRVSGTVRDKISNEVLVGATVKVIDEDNNEVMSAITDSEGKYSLLLDCDQGNFVRALTEGYIPAEEYLGKSDGSPKTVDFFLERNTVSAGFGDDLAKLLQLSTIYFDFDKYNIRKDSEIEVEKVIAAMEKYPSLKIKVNSHTDSRGKDAYNLWLSQKRAESTVNYMIQKGISPDRLQSEGYGETKLINRCANGVKCSDKEHQLNRRSEFIILE